MRLAIYLGSLVRLGLGLGLGVAACSKKSHDTPDPAAAGNTSGTTVGTTTGTPGVAIVSPIKYYNHFPFNHVYTLNLGLGAQSIESVLDTGSANFLAIGDSAHCSACDNLYGYSSVYTPSGQGKALDATWSINFLPIGAAQVHAYEDTLTFEAITVPNYNFGLVTSETGIPNIWGLAYQTGASPHGAGQMPPFDAFLAAAQLANKFSLRLCATKTGSSMVLGGFDAAAIADQAKIQWTPIIGTSQYLIGVDRVYIGPAAGTTTPQWIWQPETDDSLIVDSGTNPLTIDPTRLAALVSVLTQVATANGMNLPAAFWPTTTAHGGYATLTDAQVAKFPPLLVDVHNASGTGTFTLTISPSTYIQTRDNGQRFLGIEAGATGIYLLGTVFMENYVVLFDRGAIGTGSADPAGRIGFYPVTGLCK